MSKGWLHDRERGLEEEYFQRRDRELIEQLRAEGQRDRDRQELSGALGITDSLALELLRKAGFEAGNLVLLHLVPLVEVAWGDGAVSVRERELILAMAERRGVSAGSPAHARLVQWLERRPDAEFFDTAFAAMGALLDKGDAEDRAAAEQDLVDRCVRVAEATGGILGMGAVSKEERECLSRISERLSAQQREVSERRQQS